MQIIQAYCDGAKYKTTDKSHTRLFMIFAKTESELETAAAYLELYNLKTFFNKK